jgi:hypothetical protein
MSTWVNGHNALMHTVLLHGPLALTVENFAFLPTQCIRMFRLVQKINSDNLVHKINWCVSMEIQRIFRTAGINF